MSLFKNILGSVAPIVGGMLGGPAGAAIGGAIGGAITRPRGILPTETSLPGVGFGGPSMALGGLAPIAGAAVRVGVAGARTAMNAAIAWCRRNPAWCASVGGTAAVAAMVESGQLPKPRRRRGRGLSGRDLRSYRRVHNLLAGFCAPKARIRKVC